MGKKNRNGPTPLAVLSEADLMEYRRRKAMVDQTKMQLLAVAAYMDALHHDIVTGYGLPTRFELDLETGYCSEVTDAEATSV